MFPFLTSQIVLRGLNSYLVVRGSHTLEKLAQFILFIHSSDFHMIGRGKGGKEKGKALYKGRNSLPSGT